MDWDAIDTVLLDMDGTLLDLRFDNYFWGELVPARYAARRGFPLPAARTELTARFAARQGTLEWYCTDFWSNELGLDIAALKHEFREHIRFLPGATDFLASLRARGKKIVLMTNAHQHALAIKCAHTGLAAYLDEQLSSHSLGFPKESAQFWPAAQAVHPFDRERTLFIDDSLAVLRAAHRYGLQRLVMVTRPDFSLPPRPAAEFAAVESVAELIG